MNPADISVFYHPQDTLRLTVKDDRSYLRVKPVWAAPLSRPNTYLAFLDGKDREIALFKHPEELDESSWKVVQQELHARYLTAQIKSILGARQEFGVTYWSVDTDRGERDFVTQNLQENALLFSDHHILLLDVDGNRFEIKNSEALDPRSRNLLESIL